MSTNEEQRRQVKAEDEEEKEAASTPELRSVRSQPSMMSKMASTAHRSSLRDLRSRSGSSSRDPSLHSSQSTLKGGVGRTSLESMTAKRASPRNPNEQQRQSSPGDGGLEDNNAEMEEDGGHDTITSLAGVKMMAKYRKAISGSRANSSASGGTNNQTKLEALFQEEESLEDIRESDDDNNEDEDKKSLLQKHQQESEEVPLPTAAAAADVQVDEKAVFIPPDGGYAWFIALGAFLAMFWSAGTIKSFGIIFKEIILEFPESKTLASWIPAAITSISLIMSPVTSALCTKYTCRYVTLAGALCCSGGLILSSFASSIEWLFVTLGLITGLGMGLSATPGVIIVARYFDKNRAKANAFCLSGTAVGSFVLPLLMQTVLAEYGLRGTLLLLGGCMLHICISAALYRPHYVHTKIMAEKAEKKKKKVSNSAVAVVQIPAETETPVQKRQSHCRHHNHHHNHQNVQLQPNEVLSHLRKKLHSLEVNEDADSVSVASSEHQLHPPNVRQSSQSSLASGSLPPWDLQLDDFRGGGGGGGGGSPMRTRSPMRELQFPYQDPIAVSDTGIVNSKRLEVQQARAVSLRELYFHQLGSKINSYKKRMMGHEVAEAAAAGPTSSSKQSLNQAERSRRSSKMGASQDCLKREDNKKQPQNGKKNRKKNNNSNNNFKCGRISDSLMFSFEDFNADSTCHLKDTVCLSRQQSKNDESGGDPHYQHHHRFDRSMSERPQSPHYYGRPRFSSVAGGRRQRTLSEGQQRDDPILTSRFKLMYTPRRSLSVTTKASSSEGSKLSLHRQMSLKSEPSLPEEDENRIEEEEIIEEKKGCCSKVSSFLDLSLLKEPLFLLICVSVMCVSVGFPHALFFLPSHAVNVDAGLVLSLASIFDLVGRLAAGFILDAKLIRSELYYSFAILLAGTCVIILPQIEEGLLPVTLVAGFMALGTGTWFLMQPLLLTEFLGVERIGSAYGLVRFFQAWTNLCGPIIGGIIWEQTGDVSNVFYFMGSIVLAGGFISFFILIWSSKLKNEEKLMPVEEDEENNVE